MLSSTRNFDFKDLLPAQKKLLPGSLRCSFQKRQCTDRDESLACSTEAGRGMQVPSGPFD